MRALLVVAVDEGVEARLLLQDVGRGRLGGFLLQREMHPLVPPVLLGMPGLDALELNPEPEPPHRQLAQPVERMGEANGTPLSVRIARGSPNSLKARSKTEKA